MQNGPPKRWYHTTSLTRRHSLEDGDLNLHRREISNLESFLLLTVCELTFF